MILKAKTVKADSGYVKAKVPIKITEKAIRELNQKIAKDIAKNDKKRIKGLEIAKKCIMK